MRRTVFGYVAACVLLVVVLPGSARAWTWPVEGPVLRPFAFDAAHPYAGGQHRGIDIGASAGAAVVAPASGIVSYAGSLPTNGRTVTIRTVDGWSVTLVHLGAYGVSGGQAVTEGDAVGSVGPSGVSDLAVPFVYLGVRRTDDPNGYVDPLSLLPAGGVAVPPAAPPTPEPPQAPAAPSPQPPTATDKAAPAATPTPGKVPPPAADAGAAGAETPPAADTPPAAGRSATDGGTSCGCACTGDAGRRCSSRAGAPDACSRAGSGIRRSRPAGRGGCTDRSCRRSADGSCAGPARCCRTAAGGAAGGRADGADGRGAACARRAPRTAVGKPAARRVAVDAAALARGRDDRPHTPGRRPPARSTGTAERGRRRLAARDLA